MRRNVLWLFLLFLSLLSIESISAQQGPSDAQIEDALFMCLSQTLQSRPGELRDSTDHKRAYDPNTGKNYVYDTKKRAWIDTKTGESICPRSDRPANLEDALFLCLSATLNVRPAELRDANDHTRAYDPKSGRNFSWNKKKQAWIDTKTGEAVCPKIKPESDECKRPLTEKGAIACIDKLIARLTKALDARRAELGDRPYFKECNARLKTIFDEVGVPADEEYVDFWGSVCTSWDAASVFYTRHLDNLKTSKRRIETFGKFTEPDIKYLEDGVELWYQEETKLVSLMIERWKHLRTSGEYRRDWSAAVKRTRAAKTDTERMVAEAAESVAYHTNRNYYDTITKDNSDFRAFGDKTIFTSIPRVNVP